MTTGIRSDASGTFGALTFGGDDAVTFDATGIQAGSYKPGSIVANDFADGALIENSVNGIGYGIGAGGTVTQATSKSTPVTLNKPCGQITMHNAALAAGTTTAFSLYSTHITSSDVVFVGVSNQGVSTHTAYWTEVSEVGNGSCVIFLTNRGAAPLSEAVKLNFAIIKGATS